MQCELGVRRGTYRINCGHGKVVCGQCWLEQQFVSWMVCAEDVNSQPPHTGVCGCCEEIGNIESVVSSLVPGESDLK